MLTDEAKKQIRDSVLKIIEIISDKEYQRRVWINGELIGTDFDETVNHFSLDGDGILEKHEDFWITEVQYQVLKKFRDAFHAFSDNNYWPPEFIDSTEWNGIIKMAKEVLHSFNYQAAASNQFKESNLDAPRNVEKD